MPAKAESSWVRMRIFSVAVPARALGVLPGASAGFGAEAPFLSDIAGRAGSGFLVESGCEGRALGDGFEGGDAWSLIWGSLWVAVSGFSLAFLTSCAF